MDVYILELKKIPAETGGTCHYAQLVDEVLRGGNLRPLTQEDMEERIRLRRDIKKAVERGDENVVLSFKDGELLKETARTYPWGLALEHVLQFLQDIKAMRKSEDYELHGNKKKDSHEQ